jgi:pheromone shutdown protein TraB
VLINGVLAALGALIAGGHILTVVMAFVAAPITSLNPTIAAGWVAGLTEAWIRKPKVEDFESLAQDITSLKGFRRNEITKILLVVVLSNVGSGIGTLIGVPLVASLLQ